MITYVIRPDIPPPPARMQRLPIDERGYPVPYFVQWIHGKPEFRLMDPAKQRRCMLCGLCWVCGEPLEKGRLVAFVIGPMCAVNRLSSEPPSHPECAEYSAKACPFLTKPQMIRRESDLPEGVTAEIVRQKVAGIMITRNPGATLVWITRRFKVETEPRGYLWRIGDPVRALWFARGRRATREEVLASIESGLPILRSYCDLEEESERDAAHRELDASIARAMRLVPKPKRPFLVGGTHAAE